MTSVLSSITVEQSPWAVLSAVAFCIAGFWVTIRLLERVRATERRQRLGWVFLAGIAAGSTAWCTHFIGLLGFRPDEPVSFYPAPIMAALLIGVIGTQVGILASTRPLRGHGPAIGGAIIGMTALAVQLCGLWSYRVEGAVQWRWGLLAIALVLAAGLGAAGLWLAVRDTARARRCAVAVLVAMVVGTYIVIAAAFQVNPLPAAEPALREDAFHTMLVAVTAVGMVILSTGLASVVIDRHARSDSFERLHHMAMHDALTGLPNRNSFKDHLDQQIAKARQTGAQFAVIGIDLDRFKEINDQRGHQYGDEALRILARRLIELAGADEYVARLGGDEFVAIRPFTDRSELVEFLSRLKSAFYSPLRMDSFEITTGASLGVALYPQDGQTREVLVSNSDLAMYRAKSDPLRAICFYDSSMDDVVRRQRVLANELRVAIDSEALEVHYQVQRSISGGQITGFEALARWHHPNRGYIPPAEFIPLAEESGLIHRLGEYVLRRACADAMGWVAPYKVAVNLSALQLSEPTFADLVRDVLEHTGLPPHRLELELTESSLMKDGDRSVRAMHRIKELGVGIALDDFGTGYSSLATLRNFPIDKIKLDRSFIADVETCQESIAIVRAVLALGKSLRIPVLAEGIERQNQLAILRAEGCDEAQGYLFGHPTPLRSLRAAGRSLLGKASTRGAARLKEATAQAAGAAGSAPISAPISTAASAAAASATPVAAEVVAVQTVAASPLPGAPQGTLGRLANGMLTDLAGALERIGEPTGSNDPASTAEAELAAAASAAALATIAASRAAEQAVERAVQLSIASASAAARSTTVTADVGEDVGDGVGDGMGDGMGGEGGADGEGADGGGASGDEQRAQSQPVMLPAPRPMVQVELAIDTVDVLIRGAAAA